MRRERDQGACPATSAGRRSCPKRTRQRCGSSSSASLPGRRRLPDELTAPEFVSHDRGNPTSDREGVKQIVGAIKAAFPDVAFTADDVIGEGDRMAARFTMRGTQTGEFLGVPPTNKPIVVTGIDIVRFDSGKAVEHWHEWSGMELLQQLGGLGSQ